jgi:hypothetical protein
MFRISSFGFGISRVNIPGHIRLAERLQVVFGLLLLGLACGPGASEEEAGLAIECSVEEREGISSFHVTCTGDLPDGALLRAEVEFLKPVSLPPALQKETGRKFELAPVSIGKSSERMRQGTATFVVGIMRRKPYSGEYVVRVSCPREGQRDDVLSKVVGRLPMNSEKRLVFGKADDFDVESESARAALRADLLEMKELWLTLASLFKSRVFVGTTATLRQEPLETAELVEWTKDLAEWTRSLNTFLERNDERPDVEVFWAEFVGKRTISLRAELLRKLGEGYDEALNSLPISAEKYQNLQISSGEIGSLLEMDFEYFGFGKQLDVQRLLALISNIKIDLEQFVNWAGNAPSEADAEELGKWKSNGEGAYEKLAEKTMELLTGLQGVSLRNTLTLTNAVAEMMRIARCGGSGTANALTDHHKRARDALERIAADAKAEPSR